MTTPPLSRMAGETVIDSMDDDFSAFVFKIQANMNAQGHFGLIVRYDEQEVYPFEKVKPLMAETLRNAI